MGYGIRFFHVGMVHMRLVVPSRVCVILYGNRYGSIITGRLHERTHTDDNLIHLVQTAITGNTDYDSGNNHSHWYCTAVLPPRPHHALYWLELGSF